MYVAIIRLCVSSPTLHNKLISNVYMLKKTMMQLRRSQ